VKRGSNRQSIIKCLPYGENLVKIHPVDCKFFLLKGLFLKDKKIIASRTYTARGRTNTAYTDSPKTMHSPTLSGGEGIGYKYLSSDVITWFTNEKIAIYSGHTEKSRSDGLNALASTRKKVVATIRLRSAHTIDV